jgi:hypothetical protein
MDSFTCVTSTSDECHISQHAAANPEAAVRLHARRYPLPDGEDPESDLVTWLSAVTDGSQPVTLQPVAGCRETWLWREGLANRLRFTTYVVRTKTTP